MKIQEIINAINSNIRVCWSSSKFIVLIDKDCLASGLCAHNTSNNTYACLDMSDLDDCFIFGEE